MMFSALISGHTWALATHRAVLLSRVREPREEVFDLSRYGPTVSVRFWPS